MTVRFSTESLSRFSTNTVSRVHSTLTQVLCLLMRTEYSFRKSRNFTKATKYRAHTSTHPTIERCPLDQVVQQVIEDRKALEDAVGYPVRGLSYPNGSYSKDIINLLPACGIEYSRVVGSTDDFAFPDNFLEWKSTCHHGHNLMQNAERFADLHKTQYLYMMYVWGHSYEFDRDNSWDLIEGFCKFIGGRDDIWYATNIEIVDYMNAAKNLKYTANGDRVYNPNAISVWLKLTVNITKSNRENLKKYDGKRTFSSCA